MRANEQPQSSQPSKSGPIDAGTTHVSQEILERIPSPAVRPSRRIHTEPDLVFDEIVETVTRKSAS